MLKTIELFAGVGGFRLGLERNNTKSKKHYKIVWSNQWEPSTNIQHASDVYEARFGKKNHSSEDIAKVVKDKFDSIPDHDLLVGGFPCQGFSISNPNRKKYGMNDERNFLYKEMLRVIDHVEPKYFVAENVKGILNLEKGRIMPLIINDFKELGYNVDFRLFDTSLYGVPQIIYLPGKINH